MENINRARNSRLINVATSCECEDIASQWSFQFSPAHAQYVTQFVFHRHRYRSRGAGGACPSPGWTGGEVYFCPQLLVHDFNVRSVHCLDR